MQITVKLFATFRNGRFDKELQEQPEGTDCRTIVAGLGLTEREIGIILVNGRHAPFDQELQEGDILALFPLIGGG